MRFRSTFFVLLSFYLGLSNGTPPGKGIIQNSRYTEEEDQFILDELAKISESQISNKWTQLAQKFREKWLQGTPGFIKARSTASLRDHVKRVLVENHPYVKALVPDELHKEQGYRKRSLPYNKEENNFIVEELLNPNCEENYGALPMETIRARHDIKRLAGTPGFESKRSVRSLRVHISAMAQNNQLNEQIIKKFPRITKANYKRTLPYNKEESDFVVKELLKPSCEDLYSTSTMKAILAGHDTKRLAGTPGFGNERSVKSLRMHIFILAQNGQLSEQVIKKFPMLAKGYLKRSAPYTKEENDLIFEELLKPECEEIYSTSTMEVMRFEHDRKRLAGKPGFENERTINSLRTHINALRKKGLMDPTVMKKFPLLMQGASSSTSTSQNPQTSSQVANEGQDEEEWFVDLMEEFEKTSDENVNEELENIEDINDMIEELLDNTNYKIDLSKRKD